MGGGGVRNKAVVAYLGREGLPRARHVVGGDGADYGDADVGGAGEGLGEVHGEGAILGEAKVPAKVAGEGGGGGPGDGREVHAEVAPKVGRAVVGRHPAALGDQLVGEGHGPEEPPLPGRGAPEDEGAARGARVGGPRLGRGGQEHRRHRVSQLPGGALRRGQRALRRAVHLAACCSHERVLSSERCSEAEKIIGRRKLDGPMRIVDEEGERELLA